MTFFLKYWKLISAIVVAFVLSYKFDFHYRLLPVPDRNKTFLTTCKDALSYNDQQCKELRNNWGQFMDDE